MEFTAVIEIGKGSYLKSEKNKETGVLMLDRVLPIPCPQNYGFIKDLPIQADGDDLDVFVISFEPLIPLSEVKVRIIGMLLCDDNGIEDNKCIGLIVDDFYKDYDHLKAIKFYLEHYKKGFSIKEYKVFNDELVFRNYVGGFK